MRVELDEPAETKVVQELRRRIAFGYYQSGDLLPNELALAEELGISRATVGKALRKLDKDGFFIPRRGVGRIVTTPAKTRKTHNIGIVLSDPLYYRKPGGGMIIETLHRQLIKNNYNLNIIPLIPRVGIFHYMMRQHTLSSVNPSDLDAMILITQSVEMETALELSTYCPIVWFYHPSVKAGISGIRYDWIGGSYQAVKHLVANGHKHIALVNILESFTSGREQLDGARLAVSHLNNGEKIDLQLYPVNTFDEESIVARQVEKILSSNPRPTAIISGSDDFTLAIYNTLEKHKLKVPDDISFISWNDTFVNDKFPTPDAIRIDFQEVGNLVAEQVIKMIEHPAEYLESITIKTQLIVRNTVKKI